MSKPRQTARRRRGVCGIATAYPTGKIRKQEGKPLNPVKAYRSPIADKMREKINNEQQRDGAELMDRSTA